MPADGGGLLVTQTSAYAALKRNFDGTWRPDYEPPDRDAPPEVIALIDGIFECRTCEPPYSAPADGVAHAIAGNTRFETLAITVLDASRVQQVGRRGAQIVFESAFVISADGNTRTETRTAMTRVGDVLVPTRALLTAPPENQRVVLFRTVAHRLGRAPQGAHRLTGAWKVVEVDLLHHDEDTTYAVARGALRMTDRLGRSFTASLDSAEAPYRGDPRMTGVSVRAIDDWTIEEVDRNGENVVQVVRWQVGQDGLTMHARFEDAGGNVMEQSGHKVR